MEEGTFVRDYQPEDFERLREIHDEMGLDYQFPDLGNPLFLVRKVLVVEGVIRAAAVARLEVEVMLLIDRSWGDADEKLAAMKMIQKAGMQDAWLQGVQYAVAWVPPQVEKVFAPYLKELGWEPDRDGWHTWSRPIIKD